MKYLFPCIWLAGFLPFFASAAGCASTCRIVVIDATTRSPVTGVTAAMFGTRLDVFFATARKFARLRPSGLDGTIVAPDAFTPDFRNQIDLRAPGYRPARVVVQPGSRDPLAFSPAEAPEAGGPLIGGTFVGVMDGSRGCITVPLYAE